MKEICLYSHVDEKDDTKKMDEMDKKLKLVEKEEKYECEFH